MNYNVTNITGAKKDQVYERDENIMLNQFSKYSLVEN